MKTQLGAELWAEYTDRGTYQVRDEESGLLLTRPKRELERYIIRQPRQPETQDLGIIRARMPAELSQSGRALEFMRKSRTEKDYTLSRSEKDALMASYENAKGIAASQAWPLRYQLSWEREVHGPQSPTLEQEAVASDSANVASIDVTYDSTPTSNNLLLGSGMVKLAASPSDITIDETGWADDVVLTRPGPADVIVLGSKISAGSEGTITFTITGDTDDMAGWVAEYSGMATSSPFDVSSTNFLNDGTTEISTGTTATTAQADALAIAAFGTDDGITNEAYTNSFAEQAEVASDTNEIAFRVASKTLTATGTVETTFSWTNGSARKGAVLGVYKASGGGGGAGLIPSSLALMGVGI